MNSNNEYKVFIDFIINEIYKTIKLKKDEIYIGYTDQTDFPFLNEVIEFNLPLNRWKIFYDILLKDAIELECYEHCNKLKNANKDFEEYISNLV